MTERKWFTNPRYENIDKNIFFSLKKDNRTRGHKVALVKDQCRLDIRKYSFSQRTVNEWNKLSTDCVTASSVNIIKTRLTHISGGWITHRFKMLDSISQWLVCPLAI